MTRPEQSLQVTEFIKARLDAEMRGLPWNVVHALIHTDRLTGALSRWGLDSHTKAIGEAIKVGLTNRVIGIYFDLDDFKKLQDMPGHGHKWGDDALQTFAACVQRSLRKTDVLARVGGDEFFALLPGAREKDVAQILKMLWDNLDENPVPHRGGATRLHATYGIAVYPGGNLRDLVHEAAGKMESEKQKRG